MADVNNLPEPTFPSKRTSDVTLNDSSIDPKKQKLETLENPNFTTTNNNNQKSLEEKEEETKRQQSNDEEEEREKERLNGKAEIDRKGKGILIEEDEDDDDEDDDSDDDSDDDDDDDVVVDELSEDSDFVDDPLGEVDLDNILPSRTRRKTVNPGSYLATDIPEEEDDDESDDPDA